MSIKQKYIFKIKINKMEKKWMLVHLQILSNILINIHLIFAIILLN